MPTESEFNVHTYEYFMLIIGTIALVIAFVGTIALVIALVGTIALIVVTLLISIIIGNIAILFCLSDQSMAILSPILHQPLDNLFGGPVMWEALEVRMVFLCLNVAYQCRCGDSRRYDLPIDRWRQSHLWVAHASQGLDRGQRDPHGI
jgi:hypothetical protein